MTFPPTDIPVSGAASTEAMETGLQMPPLTLYVHLPWCVRKCPYCDFNSHEQRADSDPIQYVDALIRDLDCETPLVWGRTVHAVFFGGGTPSLFPPAEIHRLLDAIRSRLRLAPEAEITLEANPGTIEHGRFAGYRAAGVNRVSLGAQSFAADRLKRLGRIHGPDDIRRAVDELRQAGLDNFNLDLMYGLPDQSPAAAAEDVQAAIALQPAHISHYQLTLEPNTRFAAFPPVLPDDDRVAEMETLCCPLLDEAGYRHYEISAWARTDAECRHNLNYWRFGDYLAIGAGAHGKLTVPAEDAIWRVAKQRHPQRYQTDAGRFRDGRHQAVAERRSLSAEDRVLEFFLNHLRLAETLPRTRFEARTGLSWDIVAERVDRALQDGLLVETPVGVRPSPRGHCFLNELQARFLPD